MKNQKLALSSLIALTCSVAAVGQVAPQQAPVTADFVVPGDTETLPPPVAAAAASVRPATLAAHISALSSPAFEGRSLGSRGLDATAEYVAASFVAAGVAPLRPGSSGRGLSSYFHAVPLVEVSRPSGEVVIETRRGNVVDAQTFRGGIDVAFPEVAPETFSAPLVFAGYGIREQSPARDDYRGLAVKDSIVVLIAGVPTGAEWQAPALVSKYASASSVRQRFAAKAQLAASLGARAVIAIENEEFAARLASASSPAPTFFVPGDEAVAAAPPVVQVSPRVAHALLQPAGLDLSSAATASPRALTGATGMVRITGEERGVLSRNVVAVVPGSDAKLRNEAVVIGAHMDHLGRAGSTMYPGADDNASGVAALIEIARALAAAPEKPRRTIVFACWTGEEEGKLGSGYYVRHPLWPLERTSVYLNLDMIGHPWTPAELRQLVTDTRLENGEQFLAKVAPTDFIELGVAEWAPEVGTVLKRAARGTGLALHLDRTDGKNGGSDYRDFARRGLPWVRFFGNYFEGYHEPTDTADKVDPGQVLRVTRLALASAWLLADEPARRPTN